MTVYCYLRVSSSAQTLENQRFALCKFAKANNIEIDFWVEETISSRKTLQQRQLSKLLEKLKTGDILISTELSRLGRSMFEVISILQACLQKNCQIWTLKENYRLGADIQSKVLAFAFTIAFEIERQMISSRTKESLKRLKNSGKHLGRPFQSKTAFTNLKQHKQQILALAKQKVPKLHIAQMFHVSRSSIIRFIKAENQNNN